MVKFDRNIRNEEFKNMYRKGYSVSEISRQTGWGRETVRLAVKDLPEYIENTKDIKNNKSTKNTQKDIPAAVDTEDKLSYLQNQFSGEEWDIDSCDDECDDECDVEDIDEDEYSLEYFPDEENDIKWIANSAMITVSINGKIYQADSTHPNFKNIIDKCINEDFDDIEHLFNLGKSIEEYSMGLFKFERGILSYAGEPIHGVLIDKIINDIQEGNTNVNKYLNFIEHCLDNQKNSIDELWSFLKHTDIKINDDGFIIGYKKVKENYNGDLVDSHTGTVINNVGTVVTMPRQFVNDNKNQTCSYGLHVGSLEYVKDFYGSVIIKVLLNPSDVVSVPVDYNGQKLRCSEYFVIEQLDDELNTIKQSNGISGFSLVNRKGLVQYEQAK